MERRKEPRVSTNALVWMTVLKEGEVKMPVLAVEASGRGMRIVTRQPVPVGAAVKLEPEDALILGEVCYCQPGADGFSVGLRLDQVLTNLKALERLNLALCLDEAVARPREGAAVRTAASGSLG